MDEIIFFKIIKSLHIIFVTTWMAGLFYLPRIFVYHSNSTVNSKEYETFIIMERKLLKYIMNPSFVLTWIFGLLLVIYIREINSIWFYLKFFCVVVMSIFHMYCAKIRKIFENKKNIRGERFYRFINEVPTVLFVIIVFLVVFKPMN